MSSCCSQQQLPSQTLLFFEWARQLHNNTLALLNDPVVGGLKMPSSLLDAISRTMKSFGGGGLAFYCLDTIKLQETSLHYCHLPQCPSILWPASPILQSNDSILIPPLYNSLPECPLPNKSKPIRF